MNSAYNVDQGTISVNEPHQVCIEMQCIRIILMTHISYIDCSRTLRCNNESPPPKKNSLALST